LLRDVEQQIDRLEQGIARRKQYESSVTDITSWLKTTESELSKPLKLDANARVVTAVLNKYKVQRHVVESVNFTEKITLVHCGMH